MKRWLRRGASLVANDIDTLWPGTAAAADALERRLGGKVQSNLYCSWNQHQAFDTHFDTHDIFALHCAGAIHLAFGLTYIIGIDVLTMLFEQAMSGPLSRTNAPLPEAGPGGRRR